MLNRVYANVLNKPILIPQSDVTSLGSAIFAAMAAKAFDIDRRGAAALCPKHRVIEPDPKAAKVYEECTRYIAICILDLGRRTPAGFGGARAAGAAADPARRARQRMILKTLREEVLEANLELVRRGLVLYTFGNASGIDRKQGLVAIKPSGVPYESMKSEDLVVVDLEGKKVEGDLRPSSDLPTHLILYKAFEGIGGVAHTHSRFATAWAQAAREIPCFGTTHADYFYGPIPVTRTLTPKQIRDDYEVNTGHAIVAAIREVESAAHARSFGGGARAVLLGHLADGSGACGGDRGRDCGDGDGNGDRQPEAHNRSRNIFMTSISCGSTARRRTTGRKNNGQSKKGTAA